MSKIESGKLVMMVADFSVLDLLEQIEMSFRPQMEARSQEFLIEKCRISHEWLIGDSVRVLQILNNLLSNAMKYTQTGRKITLHVEELVPTSDHYAQMCLRVADNGIGGYEGTDKNSVESSDGRRSGRNFKLKKSGRVFIMDGKNKTERQCRYA